MWWLLTWLYDGIWRNKSGEDDEDGDKDKDDDDIMSPPPWCWRWSWIGAIAVGAVAPSLDASLAWEEGEEEEWDDDGDAISFWVLWDEFTSFVETIVSCWSKTATLSFFSCVCVCVFWLLEWVSNPARFGTQGALLYCKYDDRKAFTLDDVFRFCFVISLSPWRVFFFFFGMFYYKFVSLDTLLHFLARIDFSPAFEFVWGGLFWSLLFPYKLLLDRVI